MNKIRHSTMNWIAMASFFIFFSGTDARASAYEGTVTNVYPYGGVVYVIVSGGSYSSSNSNCSMGLNGIVFSIDIATTFGKILVANAITAKTTGRRVYAVGNDTCGSWNPFNSQSNEGLIGMDLKG